jgi:hypothetical protein
MKRCNHAWSGANLLQAGLMQALAACVAFTNPNEYEPIESNTHLLGWFESEIAYKTHADYDMSAWVGYGLVGYIARAVPWTPSLSYRYTSFSGDDADTSTFERFDPLFTGGLSHWLQGIQINKVLNQANRNTHRLRLNVTPHASLNLTLDYFMHTANALNNPGGNPALRQLRSHDLGQEIQFAARWAISPNPYFVGVASYAIPGEAIERAREDDIKPWSTLQAQLYWHF